MRFKTHSSIGSLIMALCLFFTSTAFAQSPPTGAAAMQATSYQAALAHARTVDLAKQQAQLRTDLDQARKDLAGARSVNRKRADVLGRRVASLEQEIARINQEGLRVCNDLAETETQKACVQYFRDRDIGIQEKLIELATFAATRCKKKGPSMQVAGNSMGSGAVECDPNAPASPVVLEHLDKNGGYRVVIGGDPDRSAVPGGNLDASIGTSSSSGSSWRGSTKKTVLVVGGSSLLGALVGYGFGEHNDRREIRHNPDGSTSLLPGDGKVGAIIGLFAGAAAGFVVDMVTN